MNIYFLNENLIYIFVLGVVFSLYFLLRKNKKLILLPELIPYSMHYKNVRAVLPPEYWQKIAKLTYKKSKYKCDICHAKGKLECHEIWYFDDINLIQKLIGLTSLCPDCHRVKHIGLAKKFGHYNQAIKHMAKVNGISIFMAKRYVKYAEIEVKNRKNEYSLDLTYLNQFSNILPRKYTSYENMSCKKINGNW
jgi:hypothetical protein